MDSTPRIHRIAGLLMIGLAAALCSMVWLGGEGPFNTSLSGHEALQAALDNSAVLAAQVAVSLLASVLAVALAASLYARFRPHGETLAALAGLGLVILGGVLLAMAIAGVALSRTAIDFEGASGAGADVLAGNAHTVTQLTYSGWLVGYHAPLPLALLALGVLFLRKRLLPNAFGWLAVAGGLLLVGGALVLVGAIAFGSRGPFWMLGPLGLLVAMLWLLVTGGWLLVKGTRKPAQVSA